MGQFPNCEIKLCDLDVARVIQEDEDFKEIIGTPDYVGKVFYIFHSGLKKAKKRGNFQKLKLTVFDNKLKVSLLLSILFQSKYIALIFSFLAQFLRFFRLLDELQEKMGFFFTPTLDQATC